MEAGTGSKKPAFGTIRGISHGESLVVIKPSGVPYQQMKPEHLVVTDLARRIMEGKPRLSSDLLTPRVLDKHSLRKHARSANYIQTKDQP